MSGQSRDKVRVYNNVLSPVIKSPPSPINQDGAMRGSADHGSTIIPRLSTLEARTAAQATEIELLRQNGDVVDVWRDRVDSASAQTAFALEALNQDVDQLRHALETMCSESGTSRDTLTNMSSELERLAEELRQLSDRHGNDTNVMSRLEEVELRLRASEIIMEENEETIASNIARLDSDAKHTGETVAMMNSDISSMSMQVQTLKLALEVVEQSLEDFDESETIESLRSRMDDLDAGIEKTADEALEQVSRLQMQLSEMEKAIERSEAAAAAAEAKATQAATAAASAEEEISQLRHHILVGEYSGNSAASSPRAPKSDSRIKAAVHTLSDGYRSLHKAMSLMYEEQVEMARKIGNVGREACNPRKGSGEIKTTEKIAQLEERTNCAGLAMRSHPIYITGEDAVETPVSSAGDVQALMASHVKDLQRAEKRADALEREVKELKGMLMTLYPSSRPSSSLSTPRRTTLSPLVRRAVKAGRSEQHVKVNMVWCDHRRKFLVHLTADSSAQSVNEEWKIGALTKA